MATTTLTDGKGFTWDIYEDGRINNGSIDAYDGGMDLSGYTPSTGTHTLEDGGREVLTETYTSGGIETKRKIYVPNATGTGFARFLDFFTNTSSGTQTVSVQIDTNLGSDSSTVIVSTSSGDSTVASPDRWIVSDDSTDGGGDPELAHVFGKAGAAVQPTASAPSTGYLRYTYNFTLAAGETKIIMHFAAQNSSRAEATTTAKWLYGLPNAALSGMSATEKAKVVNWTVSNPTVTSSTSTTLPASKSDLVLTGSKDISGTGNAKSNKITGNSGDNTLKGLAGKDTIDGKGGDDRIYGGLDDDVLIGGLGNDFLDGEAGNDKLYGDSSEDAGTQTSIKQVNLPAGGKLAVSLTAPDATNDSTIKVSGYVAADKSTIGGSGGYNIAFVVDISGSTGSGYGGAPVGDLNGNGDADEILDAEIKGVRALLTSLINKARVGGANAALIPFQSSATIAWHGLLADDTNANGTPDAADTLAGLTDTGGTNFENALKKAIEFFNSAGPGKNIVYFLSDGQASTSSLADEHATLFAKSGLNATIKAYGIGSGASMSALDIVDDAKSNNSATQVLDPSTLAADLKASGITRGDVKKVQIFRNGTLVKTLLPKQLVPTPLGLRYNATIKGLKVNADDVIKVKVISSNSAGTAAITQQTVESVEANDILRGGSGNDKLYGQQGNDKLYGEVGNDLLDGGSGIDILNGSGGNDRYMIGGGGGKSTIYDSGGTDWIDLADASGKGTVNLANGTGNVDGEKLVIAAPTNIENVQGSRFNDNIMGRHGVANKLYGMDGNDTINGGGGDDLIVGGKGNDVLEGGAGRDTLIGDVGNDTFIVTGPGGATHIEDVDGYDTLDLHKAKGRANINLDPKKTSVVNSEKITLGGGSSFSQPLDLMFLEDLSGSFSDDLATVRALVPKLVKTLRSFQPNSRFGVASFIDKPTGGFGSSTDHVFRTDLALTSDKTQLQATIDGLRTGSGSDGPEAQIEALMQLANRADAVGYRDGSVRAVILMTDANFHKAGDFSGAPPNDGDAVLEGTPPGSLEDYPSVALLKKKLIAANIIPIFAVTSSNKTTYTDLVKQLGRGTVVTLSSDSTGLANTLKKGLRDLSRAIIEKVIGTRYNDTILGQNVANRLEGGAGNDILRGMGGKDTLVGGTGKDQFVYGAKSEGGDTIVDFSHAQGDTLRFTASKFGISTGTLSSSRFVSNTTGNATSASQRFVFNTTNNTLYYDADGSGSGAKVQIATMKNGVHLTRTDLVGIS